jgi:hypothetical protein
VLEAIIVDFQQCYLGIDPGKQGALALVKNDRTLWHLWDMPLTLEKNKQPCPYGVGKLYNEIRTRVGGGAPFTIIEKPHFRPTDGKKGVASYHLAAGYLMMPVLWGDWPIQMIPPQIWTKNIHIGLPTE